MARHRKPAQRELRFPTWGGRRKGAGRPREPDAGVPHAPRGALSRHHPVHVTLRAREHVWNLRSQRALRVFAAAVAGRHARGDGLRVVHFSLQGNHVHLIVEAASAEALSRGMQGLTVALAKGLNRMMGRRGPVFADRYHAHALETPSEVRRALAYVLLNARSHAARRGERVGPGGPPDPFSSAPAFDGWCEVPRGGPPRTAAATAPPRTWLLGPGWRRRGLLSLEEVPARPPGLPRPARALR